MHEPVFVSFYTDNCEYPQLGERLVTLLDAMKLRHDIRRMEHGYRLAG